MPSRLPPARMASVCGAARHRRLSLRSALELQNSSRSGISQVHCLRNMLPGLKVLPANLSTPETSLHAER